MLTAPASDAVYIIILNWLTWPETIACLQSVLRLNYDSARIVLCDNASSNDSLEKITAWLRDELAPDFSTDTRADLLLPTSLPPYQLIQESAVPQARHTAGSITIIQNSRNHGYAGGNNVGIRFALQDPNCSAVWILNNDVVVTPTSLSKLLPHLAGRCGIVGSRVLDYDDGSLQLAGGSSYESSSGKSRPLQRDEAQRGEMDCISGCAMLISRDLLEAIGGLSENYFLYYEEIDFAIRARAQNYTLGYADDSVIYHRHGATIGSSALSDFYLMRSRLRFTRQYYPARYPQVIASVFTTACYRFARGQWKRGYMILCLILNPALDYKPDRWGD